jgi:hypothetical protein
VTEIGEEEAVFDRWLHLPDRTPVRAAFGATAANLLSGDPFWLLLVGAPATGKTELLQPFGALPFVHPTATLTEAALLSGTSRRERAAHASGGLLREIGDFGILLCKDFSSLLSQHSDARAATMAALREVYDGSWTRHVGTDGGQALSWRGKVGFLGAVTPTIDRHHAVTASMGERFVMLRLPEGDSTAQARRALDHAGQEGVMRAELAEAVAAPFSRGLRTPRALEPDERERLIAQASLAVLSRSAVERDGYSREVELIPDAEAPSRLVLQLERLLAGQDALGIARGDAWAVVGKVALDSIPQLRRSVLEVLHRDDGEVEIAGVASAVAYPLQTTRRALEDLTAHGVALRTSRGRGKADAWSLSDRARGLYDAGFGVPETSGGAKASVPEVSGGVKQNASNSLSTHNDKSGTVRQAGALE